MQQTKTKNVILMNIIIIIIIIIFINMILKYVLNQKTKIKTLHEQKK